MNPMLSKRDVLCFFRMGMVTGLVDKIQVIAWADEEILQAAVPDPDLIELSLAAHQPYSQLIRLVSSLQGEADYRCALPMLFARAGILLKEDHSHSAAIILGLRLLNEEEYLPGDVRPQLAALVDALDAHRQTELSLAELHARLAAFLEPYAVYRELLDILD